MVSEVDDASFFCEVDAGGVFIGLFDGIDEEPNLIVTNSDDDVIVAKLTEATIKNLLQALGQHQDWAASCRPLLC